MTKGKEPAGLGADVPGTRSESTDGRLAPCPHIPPVGHPHRPRAGDRVVARAAGAERDGGLDGSYPDSEYVTVTYTHLDRPGSIRTSVERYRMLGGRVAPPSEPEPSPSRLRTHMPTIASRRALAREAAQKRLRIALDELRASVQGLGRALRETARTALLARAVPPSARKRITVAAAPDVRRMASEGRLLCRDDHPTRVGRSTWSPQSQRLRWTVPAGTNVVGGQVRSMPAAAERTDSTGDLATRRVEAVGDGVGRTLSEDSYHLHPEDHDD